MRAREAFRPRALEESRRRLHDVDAELRKSAGGARRLSLARVGGPADQVRRAAPSYQGNPSGSARGFPHFCFYVRQSAS